MSNEQQQAIIGRLVIERSDAQKQGALLWSEIQRMGVLMGNISGNFSLRNSNPDMDFALSKIDEISKRGGLEKLRDQIIERKALETRIAEITATLKDAGVRFE
jgi:hypothetical protein